MSVDEPAASALSILASLHGDSIGKVVYCEIDYATGSPAYLAGEHHSLDYGLELHLESSRTVSFIWKWPVSHYLGVLEGDLSPELRGGHASWDVSSDPRWAELLNRKINSTSLEWFKSETVGGHFPLTAKIEVCPASVVYISLGVAGEADDHLAVMFSDEVARAHGRYFERSALAVDWC
jgi:hypothetical protein